MHAVWSCPYKKRSYLCALDWVRTSGLWISSPMLYQLSQSSHLPTCPRLSSFVLRDVRLIFWSHSVVSSFRGWGFVRYLTSSHVKLPFLWRLTSVKITLVQWCNDHCRTHLHIIAMITNIIVVVSRTSLWWCSFDATRNGFLAMIWSLLNIITLWRSLCA